MKWLERYEKQAYVLMRIVAGFMFGFHGVQKIMGFLSHSQPPVGSQIWFGGLIELVGGLALILGKWQTRAVAFLCSGEMAVAYIQFHWKFQFGPKIFPAINQGELAALYCFVFLFIACRGAVRWGLDETTKGRGGQSG